MRLSKLANCIREFVTPKGASVSTALGKVNLEIQNVQSQLADANGMRKIGLQRKLNVLKNKCDRLTNIVRMAEAVDAGCEFFGALTDSFKKQFVPWLITLIILCGGFRSVASFVVGLCTNGVIMSTVICAVAYGVKQATGKSINLEGRFTRKVCQGVFIIIALSKLLYAVFPTGLFTFAVAAITIVIGICIVKGEMNSDEDDTKE